MLQLAAYALLPESAVLPISHTQVIASAINLADHSPPQLTVESTIADSVLFLLCTLVSTSQQDRCCSQHAIPRAVQGRQIVQTLTATTESTVDAGRLHLLTLAQTRNSVMISHDANLMLRHSKVLDFRFGYPTDQHERSASGT